jgi:hypothetical protein
VRRGAGLSLAAVTAVTVLAMMPCVAVAMQAVASARSVKPIAMELGRQAAATDLVVHEGPLEDSGALEWYSGHRPVIVDGLRSVLGFGANRAESRDVFWARPRLAAAWREERRIWLVTARTDEASIIGVLPRPRLVASAGGRRLYVNR